MPSARRRSPPKNVSSSGAAKPTTSPAEKAMKLKLVKSLWGMEGALEEKIRRIADAGYVAVEAQLPVEDQLPEFIRLLREHHLEFIAMVITDGAKPPDHFASFKEKIEAARAIEPLQITVHGGKDWWPFE